MTGVRPILGLVRRARRCRGLVDLAIFGTRGRRKDTDGDDRSATTKQSRPKDAILVASVAQREQHDVSGVLGGTIVASPSVLRCRNAPATSQRVARLNISCFQRVCIWLAVSRPRPFNSVADIRSI